MIYRLLFAFANFLLLSSCAALTPAPQELTLAFGSCDNQKLYNPLFKEIAKNNAPVWIWGGDNIYCDTDDMAVLAKCYETKKADTAYQKFIRNRMILGTWDDHDYARNDGGVEFEHKTASQQLFLDFMDVPPDSYRRKREGIYDSRTIEYPGGKSVQIIVLDTRYFRSPLTTDPSKKKRYIPQDHGTILGETQWNWLAGKLRNSKADFNIIVSSIQVLSNRHGYEMWGNMPHEVARLEKTIAASGASGVILLSGDRHIAELSRKNIGLKYPLIDFTSSGLTHVYDSFKSEENPYRDGFVVNKLNFGLLKLNLKTKTAVFELRGSENRLLQSWTQQY